MGPRLSASTVEGEPDDSAARYRTDENQQLAVDMTVRNVNYNALKADPVMLRAFETSVKQTIARECLCSRVSQENVQLELSPGSVVVHATVTLPENVSPSEIKSTLSTSKTLPQGLIACVQEVPGIKSVTQGQIALSDISVQKLGQQRKLVASLPLESASVTTVNQVLLDDGDFGSSLALQDLARQGLEQLEYSTSNVQKVAEPHGRLTDSRVEPRKFAASPPSEPASGTTTHQVLLDDGDFGASLAVQDLAKQGLEQLANRTLGQQTVVKDPWEAVATIQSPKSEGTVATTADQGLFDEDAFGPASAHQLLSEQGREQLWRRERLDDREHDVIENVRLRLLSGLATKTENGQLESFVHNFFAEKP